MTSYDEERSRFRLELPERFNAVLHVIEGWAAEDPAATALMSLDGEGEIVDSLSIGELARRSRGAARALMELGITKGDPLFIMLPRCTAWYSVMLGAMRIGAIPMPGTSQLTGKDIAYRIERGNAVAAITDRSAAEKIDAIGSLPAAFKHRICWSGEREPRLGWKDLDRLMDEAGDGTTRW
jgi:acyl-coenzyme A synthetase/AMP-(fatty) acid ligase